MMKDQTVSSARFNYNLATREMYFFDGEDLMKLDNGSIATLIIAGRKFIPHNKSFLEVRQGAHSSLFIDWKSYVFIKGKEGALGTVSHGFSVDQFTALKFEKMKDVSVNDIKADNSYYIKDGKKLKKFNDLKSFLKLFPQTEEQAIKDFVNEKKTNWQMPDEVLLVTDRFVQ